MQRVVQGYKAQARLVMPHVEVALRKLLAARQAVVVEGVHLALKLVMKVATWHPYVVPFLVYISNESKHRERFAIRARYMSLDARRNRYARHLQVRCRK